MGDKKWKSNLLASSFPLEFDVAKILVSKGFTVSSEYTYGRNDELGREIDFSVDIHAMGFTPFQDPNKITSTFNILAECKYRTPGTKWLFLPDVNEPDMSPVTLGRTINLMDNFSAHSVDSQSIVEFDVNLQACYKCVEIKGNMVYDKEIKHGISQLRYALPKLIKDNIEFNIFSHPEDNFPFGCCAILITTADLHIANTGLSVETIQGCSEIGEISTTVPYLLYYSDYGPDFEKHCSQQYRELAMCEKIAALDEKIEDKKDDIYDSQLPSSILCGLANSEKFYLNRYFTQFIVCNYLEFPDLLDVIKKTVMDDINKLEK